jgi:hypothetical protein
MNAKKCDVCGKFFLPYHDSDYGKVFNRMNIRAIDMNGYTFTDDDYDLCGDCAVSLNEWLESQGVDNAEAR